MCSFFWKDFRGAKTSTDIKVGDNAFSYMSTRVTLTIVICVRNNRYMSNDSRKDNNANSMF